MPVTYPSMTSWSASVAVAIAAAPAAVISVIMAPVWLFIQVSYRLSLATFVQV